MKKTKKQQDAIIKEYIETDVSIEFLARKHEIPASTLNFWLKRRNITLRKKEWNRKYTLNQNYFDKIDTEDKAYFLGFLCADGNNYEKNKYIGLALKENDKEILEKFNYYLESNRPLSYVDKKTFYNKKTKKKYTRKPQYKLHINSITISNNLTKLGCVPNKSLILQFPTENQVPSHLIRHFIRGYFDGDGSIYNYFDNRTQCERYGCEIISTTFFNEKLKRYIKSTLGLNPVIKYNKNHKKVTSSLCFASKYESLDFLNWLYQNNSICLKRKYDKYLQIKELIMNNPKKRRIKGTNKYYEPKIYNNN